MCRFLILHHNPIDRWPYRGFFKSTQAFIIFPTENIRYKILNIFCDLLPGLPDLSWLCLWRSIYQTNLLTMAQLYRTLHRNCSMWRILLSYAKQAPLKLSSIASYLNTASAVRCRGRGIYTYMIYIIYVLTLGEIKYDSERQWEQTKQYLISPISALIGLMLENKRVNPPNTLCYVQSNS